jgi:hypothetical protein
MRTVTRRAVPTVGALALAAALSACASTPSISVHKGSAPGTAKGSPTSVLTVGGSAPTTPAHSSPTVASSDPNAPSGSGASPSTPTTTAPPTTSATGSVPDVVGQSLAAAEQALRAVGYSAAAHPWGGSCATPNQVMQQVPPADHEVQLYYCAAGS